MQEASQNLNALARAAHYMNLAQRRLIMNAFIFWQFGYCPLVWMIHSRKLNNRINNIHERALTIVYRDYQSTFQQLLKQIGLHQHIKETYNKHSLPRFLRQKWFKPSNHGRSFQV